MFSTSCQIYAKRVALVPECFFAPSAGGTPTRRPQKLERHVRKTTDGDYTNRLHVILEFLNQATSLSKPS